MPSNTGPNLTPATEADMAAAADEVPAARDFQPLLRRVLETRERADEVTVAVAAATEIPDVSASPETVAAAHIGTSPTYR